MPQVEPFYRQRQQVYHVCTACPLGRAIKVEGRLSGTGGNFFCTLCAMRISSRKC